MSRLFGFLLTNAGSQFKSGGAGTPADALTPVVQLQNNLACYSASIAALAMANAATDVWQIANPVGSGKLVKVHRLGVGGGATAASLLGLSLIKRSTVNTGGTATTATNVQRDSSDAAPVATVEGYTANPTLGTAIGALRTIDMSLPAIASAKQQVSIDLPQMGTLSPVILAPGESLSLNAGGATVAGTVLDIDADWSEE